MSKCSAPMDGIGTTQTDVHEDMATHRPNKKLYKKIATKHRRIPPRDSTNHKAKAMQPTKERTNERT